MSCRAAVAAVLACLLAVVPWPSVAAQSCLPLYQKIIAIDPGHGGPDPGATRGDLREKDIVLDLSLELRDLLAGTGAITYLTRATDTDLADQNPSVSGGRKRRDILRRVDLINGWQPDLVLSIHVNAINSSRWRGAQVFYPPDAPESASLAEAIQRSLTRTLQNTNREAKVGDYRVLNDSQYPAVLVEVGFISNPEEAALLTDAAYRQQLAWAIYLGVQEWLATPATE